MYHRAINLDKMRYLVICSDHGEHYVAERYLSNMDRETTISYIATGQAKTLVSVVEFNPDPDERICGIVTEDIAGEVMTRWAHEGEPLSAWKRDFLEQHISIQAANCFRSAA